jgi:type IV pilus assembly protein PilO
MKSRNLAVGGVVAVLVIALWWMFLFSPTRNEISKVHSEVEEAERETLGLQAQLAQVSDKARNEATKAELTTLHAAVPASPELANFLRQANKIAADSGVTWQSVTPGSPSAATGGTTVTLGIQVQGGYAQVMDYLQRLQTLPRLVIVDNVNITGATQTGAGAPVGSGGGVFSTESGADTGLNLQITGRMFVAAPTATTPGPGTPAGAQTTPAGNGPTGNGTTNSGPTPGVPAEETPS